MGKKPEMDEVIKTEIKQAPKSKLKVPKLYKVVLFNDDYTTMDFVVEILISIFNKPAAEATRIMLDVHKKGKGVCGVYIYDIALTKVNQVHNYARLNEYPLRCGYEEV